MVVQEPLEEIGIGQQLQSRGCRFFRDGPLDPQPGQSVGNRWVRVRAVGEVRSEKPLAKDFVLLLGESFPRSTQKIVHVLLARMICANSNQVTLVWSLTS